MTAIDEAVIKLKVAAPGGPWGGWPGRGAWRFPTEYSTETAEHQDTPLNIQSKGRVSLGVRAIQQALVGHQFACPVNGNFDIPTDSAVQAFQRNRGGLVLGPDDGIVGPRTARALFRPYAAWFEYMLGIPSHLAVGQLSWESAGWDPGVEGQLDPRDRGLAQINSAAHPEVTDEEAYTALFSTAWLTQNMHNVYAMFGKWDYAVCWNRGPSAVEQWARTGIAPPGYLEYAQAVRQRAALETSMP